MSFTAGTASSFNDLLDKFQDWLDTVVGWTILDYVAGVADTDVATLVIRAPGADSDNNYFLYITTEHDVGGGKYGWKMNAGIDYDSTLPVLNQTLISPVTYFNTWQNSIDYWFYGSGRRVIVVAKVNTSYVSMYAGLFLPFALPSEYPKPFYLGGNYPILAQYDISNARNRFIADPGDLTAYYMNRDVNNWIKVQNHMNSVAVVNFTVEPDAFMWPHRSIRQTTTQDTISEPQSWNFNGFLNMRPLDGIEAPQILCHIVGFDELKMIGAMDGVYSLPGFGKTSEQALSFASRDFRAFQNIFRTTARDFMSIEEI